MVMATVRKIAPTNSAFLFTHELKTEPLEKFLFPGSLVSYFLDSERLPSGACILDLPLKSGIPTG